MKPIKDMDELTRMVIEQAEKKGIPKHKAIKVIKLSYDAHKRAKGSYKYLIGKEDNSYGKAMAERFNFIYNEALHYFQAVGMQQKDSVVDGVKNEERKNVQQGESYS